MYTFITCVCINIIHVGIMFIAWKSSDTSACCIQKKPKKMVTS